MWGKGAVVVHVVGPALGFEKCFHGGFFLKEIPVLGWVLHVICPSSCVSRTPPCWVQQQLQALSMNIYTYGGVLSARCGCCVRRA